MAYVNTEQLARELSVCAETIRRMAARGEIPYTRVGRLYRFKLDEVQARFAGVQNPQRELAL